MVLAMLVVLRDQGIPLPAGAILISPWVDLTHSFPSVAIGSKFDYIPEYGFMHRPSRSWPPPNSDDLAYIYKTANGNNSPSEKHANKQTNGKSERGNNVNDDQAAIQGFTVREKNPKDAGHTYPGLHSGVNRVDTMHIGTSQADTLVVPMEDNTAVEIKDQIQMYAPNQILSHPLVSPILQPSLGGLPPLLILTGGGEMLRDEQIYLAHKAADPKAYLPSDIFLDEHDPDRSVLNKYGPTNVQLQVWDDLCHVAPTLSWTRPAKFMYRSIAQFSAWTLAHAQQQEIDIPDDTLSISSKSSLASTISVEPEPKLSVGKAGDPLPPFRKHMIRQRVDRHGMVYHLDPPDSLPALQHPREKVGALNPTIVKKWLGAKKAWDENFAKEKLAVQRRRIKDFEKGYYGFDHELPPACSMASRRMEKDLAPRKPRKNYAMMMWSLLGSKHDKEALEREAREDKIPHIINKPVEGAQAQGSTDVIAESSSIPREESVSRPRLSPFPSSKKSQSRSRSRSRIVSDAGQASLNNNQDDQPSDTHAYFDRSEISRAFSSSTTATTPIILIPGVDTNTDSQSLTEQVENASTMAVLDADGVIAASRGSTSLYSFSSTDGIRILSRTSLNEQNSIHSGQIANGTVKDSESHPPNIIIDNSRLTEALPSNTTAIRDVSGILDENEKQKSPDTAQE